MERKHRRERRKARKQAWANINLLWTEGKEEEGLVDSLWHLTVAHSHGVAEYLS